MPDVQTAGADSPTTEPVVPSSPIHVRNIAFTLLSVAIVILLLQFMQSVLIPFVVAGLLFYALDAPVDWLQKKQIPRAVGAGVLLFVVVAGTSTLAYALQGQAVTVIHQLPAGARKLAALVR
jgi:predicted PurR-regulated permease PerM